jgi:hypothetical protein
LYRHPPQVERLRLTQRALPAVERSKNTQAGGQFGIIGREVFFGKLKRFLSDSCGLFKLSSTIEHSTLVIECGPFATEILPASL